MKDCQNCNDAGGITQDNGWYAVFVPCSVVRCQEESRKSADAALLDLMDRFGISERELREVTA